jgi:hypothetical protein
VVCAEEVEKLVNAIACVGWEDDVLFEVDHVAAVALV